MTNVTKESQLSQMRKLDFHENGLTRIVESVQNGDIEATKAVEYFRKLQIIAKDCEDQIIGNAEDELSRYSTAELKNGVIIGDAVMTIRSTPGRYKYHDSTIKKIQAQLKALQDLAKDSFKAMGTDYPVVNAKTGELVEPAEYINGQEKVYVSFKKKGI